MSVRADEVIPGAFFMAVDQELRKVFRVAAHTPPKYRVRCTVKGNGVRIFEGDFDCRVLKRHVLSASQP